MKRELEKENKFLGIILEKLSQRQCDQFWGNFGKTSEVFGKNFDSLFLIWQSVEPTLAKIGILLGQF